MRRYILLLAFSGVTLSGRTQQFTSNRAGVQLQLLFTVGTCRTSVGIKLNTFLSVSYAQLNLGTTYRFHAFNLGERYCFGEWRHHAGLTGMFGAETNPVNFQWDGGFHQSRRLYSLGYSHLWYVDKAGTTQRSGTLTAGIQRVDVVFENDLFAGQGKDRFRTGQLLISYRTATEKVGIGVQLWTGETKHAVWHKEQMKGAPGGYRDLSPLPYGKTSHGLLFLTAQRVFMDNQVAGLQLGVDSEQVRHIFQNKISHDLVLLPKKFPRVTPHYPRLTETGEATFDIRKKRRDRFFFQESVNETPTY